MDAKTISRLIEIVGAEGVLTSPEDLITYSSDATPLLSERPGAVVRTRTTEEVAEIMRLANEMRFPVVPRGGGTGLSGGAVPIPGCVVLLFTGWDRILEIDEENLTAWVEPGVTTARLREAVEQVGLYYPPDPASGEVCTIGGNVAENAGGLRAVKYGVTKHYVLGLEVVLPTGEIVQVGGKMVKDVAGYHLQDVLVGSEGTLGIFTKILVKLIPKPEKTRTFLALFGRLEDAAEAVSKIISSNITPSALEIMDKTTIECVEKYAHAGLPPGCEALLLIEVDGHAAVVEEDATKVERICRDHGAVEIRVASNAAEAEGLWKARRAAFPALAQVKPTTISEDITVPRSKVAPMLRRIEAIATEHDVTIGNFGHAGDGNLHPTCLTDERDEAELRRVHAAFEEIMHAALEFGGTITGEHGVGLSKREFLPTQVGNAGIRMMKAIKEALDPNGVLNPGKVLSTSLKCE